MEAASNHFFDPLMPWLVEKPEVHATLHSLRYRYDTADVNGDGKVDMRDIGFVARLFGSKIGDANWDFRADLITDGKVDMRDVGYAASHFGVEY